MQERNAEKMISLSVRATKMTANVLKSAIHRFLAAQKNKSPKVYKGKQSVKKLAKSGEKLTNIEITDENIKSFSRVARKYGIDYSLRKDKSEEPPRYFVFFKAKDTDTMTAAFKEFLGKEMDKKKKPSIREKLHKLVKELAAKNKERTREKNKQREESL
ncbi:MAG: PcfB family protein [Ruminiclostridium sp.]|nr:PcfB family protein [Ruminiclostridium sp.]